MGDGGVACVPSQHVMERFSIPETFCGGSNGKFNPKSLNMKMMKLKREEFSKTASEFGKSESVSERGKNRKEVVEDSNASMTCSKEEVEEGELGTLKWPTAAEIENGEFIPEKPRRFEIKSEIEKGEFVADKWRKGEVERGELVPGKWRKGGESHKLDFGSGRSSRRGEVDKSELGLWRGPKDEIEKGEFVPDRWRRSEVVREDSGYSKSRRHDSAKEKGGWKSERGRTPPPGKYSGEKEYNRNGNQSQKLSSRWESGNNVDRTPRISSKIVDEEGSLKNELSNGKNHGRDYPPGNRLKRHGGADADSSDWKHRGGAGEFNDYTPSKSRRVSDDGGRSGYQEHSHRNSSFPMRNIPSDRYSSKHGESPVPSRPAHDRHNSSPRHSERSPRERSPRERARYHDHRNRSPVRHDRSPYSRSHHHDHRNRSPSYSELSPRDQGRGHDRRERSPNFPEASPVNKGRAGNHRETNRKGGSTEKRQSHRDGKEQEEKQNQRDLMGKEAQFSGKDSEDVSNGDNCNGSVEKNPEQPSNKHDESYKTEFKVKESPEVNEPAEELLSMEEDMDICDTPPHVPAPVNSTTGKWFYLDHFGAEQGPSRLSDLKKLVEEGFLVSDHFIKHLDSQRWVTVEKAVSPLVTPSFPPSFSDAGIQLASPPEAPGNLLVDVGDLTQSVTKMGEEVLSELSKDSDRDDLHIDERIGAFFEGVTTIPGKELETIGEVLQMKFDNSEWERWGTSEGFICHQSYKRDHGDVTESVLSEPVPSDKAFDCVDTGDWFSGRWSCKGGDWKRVDEATQDRCWKKKFVLNDGYALCQMPKSGQEDPRLQQKDELYYPSHSRRLDLPSWAFNSSDESNDYVCGNRSIQNKFAGVRGVKGTMLPVIRINTCVVKDHGSFVSEPRTKVKGKERYSSRSSRHYSVTSDPKRSSEESVSHRRSVQEQAPQPSSKSIMPLSRPKDRLSTTDDLQLHLGDWYYLDGAGHEQGPLSFTELQLLVDRAIIQKHSSVYRKADKVWVPVTSAAETSQAAGRSHSDKNAASTDSTGVANLEINGAPFSGTGMINSFHSLHPQFIGYTRGKLHELIMKSYKSREFAAAINEVLDPWINARQPRKEMEKHMYNPALTNKNFRPDQLRASKRARLFVDGSDEDDELDKEIQKSQMNEIPFDDLCGDATFNNEISRDSEVDAASWGLLDGCVLGRVFHYLRADIKSIVYAALTCKHWRSVVKFYKDISIQADLSSVSSNCTDSMIMNIMNGYNKGKITSLILRGCTNISSRMLEEILLLLPCLSSIDIRGCSQFEDLASKFPNITWVKSRSSQSKVRSIKHTTDRTRDNQPDDSSGLRDYFASLDKRSSANQLFRQSLYKRSKVFDPRKSSSILNRGAQLRHLAIKKSGNGYRRMREFLSSGLKDIMKENTFEIFVPKVAEIENKMKNGYYAARGLSSVKEDIRRMCRDAIKMKNRSDTRNMNHIVTLFIRLATSLEDSSKLSIQSDEIMKTLKDDSPPGFCSISSKHKKLNKLSERKYANRSNGSFNSSSDHGYYASDREIRRRLSKLNRKSIDSGSETSDDLGRSSEETETDSGSTSDTATDSDTRTESGAGESKGDNYFTMDDSFDSIADEREWGARMTKASLVPPVTRKYEVIDHYVIVADQEEVQRKMRVALPDDYAEKLIAQKNGTEETDMEIPEVKDYKPRKQLGDEVVEQEVYGIDPYTHNLLLDSMPEESEWPLLEKHVFIEDVLLRTLNKQVRNFTGTGNTPMMYPLQPVFEEILKIAEEGHDTRTAELCRFVLKAICSRPDDNYVAYRKGLGVVCNKESGFMEDDFVVEFLGEVYPAWKWFEKQDGIRSLQKDSKEPAPEFYNIYLERPKGDAEGYDLVVVDAMHKANYASRICHSCRPNCEAKVTAVDGHYQIGIYSLRPILYGEEVTFDYNSVTESKEEYEASVCLCGSQVCRGSFLYLTGEGAFLKVLKDCHGILNRYHSMLEACELNSVSEEDYLTLGQAGLGSCLLGGLPGWLVAYSVRVLKFINIERTKLPEEILRRNLEEKRKYFSDICMDTERSEAEIQAEGVYNQRLQNLAVTLDKVRYVMRRVFGDPEKAPPLLERLSPEEAVSFIWKGEGSFVDDLIQSMAPHMEDDMLKDLKANIRAHDPSGSDDIQRELQKSLLWLRDEVRGLPCTYKCRHDAAADLIHIYAYTKCFVRVREYEVVKSSPVYISPLDLGPKSSEKLGPGLHEYSKTYGKNYCLGQLLFWFNQANAEPDANLVRASRGCLSLPEIGSFYAKVQKPSPQRIYGPRTVKSMLSRMEKQPQRPWPKDKIWTFKSSPKVFGSPMLDALLRDAPLDKELVHWLRHRPPIFQAMWDR